MPGRGLALALAVAAVAAACSGEAPRTPRTAGTAGTAERGPSGTTIRIVFDLPGDEMGDEESQETLRRVKERLLAGSNAEIVSSGFGMGSMEVVLKPGPGDSADSLRGLVREAAPEARYRVEVGDP